MAQIKANGLRIEAETRGDPAAPAIVLIRGLGTQLVQWPESFLEGLARHHQVVVFDNRDVGLSEKLDHLGAPKLASLMGRRPEDDDGAPASIYLLEDMAADTVGVLDAFGVERAHVFGISMGGMIAQEIAGRFPERTRSLISVMSSSGDRSLPPPTSSAMRVLMEAPERPDDRECVIEHGLAGRRVIGSPAYPDPDDIVRAELGRAFDRCRHPVGVARQLAAVGASGSRVELLRGIAAPTLVIHGTDDPLVRPECGRDTARHVPGATLEMIEGMGHDLPHALVPRFLELVLGHAAAADGR
jgi:pimeloyl-ACP methyl ester carboxylesterase